MYSRSSKDWQAVSRSRPFRNSVIVLLLLIHERC